LAPKGKKTTKKAAERKPRSGMLPTSLHTGGHVSRPTIGHPSRGVEHSRARSSTVKHMYRVRRTGTCTPRVVLDCQYCTDGIVPSTPSRRIFLRKEKITRHAGRVPSSPVAAPLVPVSPPGPISAVSAGPVTPSICVRRPESVVPPVVSASPRLTRQSGWPRPGGTSAAHAWLMDGTGIGMGEPFRPAHEPDVLLL
jgi:hypothetical protein